MVTGRWIGQGLILIIVSGIFKCYPFMSVDFLLLDFIGVFIFIAEYDILILFFIFVFFFFIFIFLFFAFRIQVMRVLIISMYSQTCHLLNFSHINTLNSIGKIGNNLKLIKKYKIFDSLKIL